MAASLFIVSAICVVALAAPQGNYMNPAPIQQKNPLLSRLEYYLNPNYAETTSFYNQQQKQGASSGPSRAEGLESLDPDSEVELLPGAQQPQQPPQQTPVAPNVPGLLPGQRVYIVHMPIPGYRPGTVGGYQPIYIVAAAPQGQDGAAYPGYQPAVVVSPSQEFSPAAGYAPPAPPALLRPFDFAYQHPYQGVQAIPAGLPQYIAQSQPQDAEQKPDDEQSNSESKSAKQVKAESQKSNESKSIAHPSPTRRS